ncbi:uncharacterized protein BKCO1_4800074 [Diplodia corticola]|uniref:Uncharacterized protein n=1 Tax=Diplodia corticola TaxID=236234 RepID=A0A1J9QSQ6_9PEZI|nr:uncharacterized protein BKCO1_4800074 [Diplodia corticola]OJD31433.1 hypothetical protein BKCO1_4800074 [Diplodia corticola]
MRFSLSIITLFLASALAAPASEAPEASGLLQARCIANGVECINDVNSCCSNLCAMDKTLGTYTCQ